MNQNTRFTTTVALIVALGGFLMGFDASVISGVVGFIETEFQLTKIQLGFSVSSLALTATLAMMFAGPLSDRIGRRPVLKIASALFAVSAIASAIAPGFITLVIARMVGGLGVGAALIIAPMYIAEIAPPAVRGRMVSFNQLNIVIGISAAFFSNYRDGYYLSEAIYRVVTAVSQRLSKPIALATCYSDLANKALCERAYAADLPVIFGVRESLLASLLVSMAFFSTIGPKTWTAFKACPRAFFSSANF